MTTIGKTVLITGANRGLGQALAVEFANAGYNLLLHSRDEFDEPPREVALMLKGAVRGDLTEIATIDNLSRAAATYDVSILVNNAGVYLGKPFTGVFYTDIRYVVEANLVAPIMLTRGMWPLLTRNRGLVINISSLAGRSGGMGEHIYAATKAGLTAFSDTLQFDGTKDGVRIINVNLGAMQTGMTNGRPGQEKFIHPRQAARTIVALCPQYETLRVTSIDIKRGQY